jgi:hypothetical protein
LVEGAEGQQAGTTDKTDDLGLEDQSAEAAIDADEEATAEAASVVGAVDASTSDLRRELAAVDDMLTFAERAALRPDARVDWLVRWIKHHMLSASTWNNRRLIIFTEWEDTRRWVQRRLLEALADTDRIDDRVAIFTGTTNQDRREEVKAAFNDDPAKEPLRILISPTRRAKASIFKPTAPILSNLTCPGTHRVLNNAMGASTVSCNAPNRCSAGISDMSNGKPTSSWRPW